MSYKPLTSGPHHIDVKLKGRSIKNSPFTANIRKGPSAKTSAVKLLDDGMEVLVGNKYQFVVEARDDTGQIVKEPGNLFNVRFIKVDEGAGEQEENVRLVEGNSEGTEKEVDFR